MRFSLQHYHSPHFASRIFSQSQPLRADDHVPLCLSKCGLLVCFPRPSGHESFDGHTARVPPSLAMRLPPLIRRRVAPRFVFLPWTLSSFSLCPPSFSRCVRAFAKWPVILRGHASSLTCPPPLFCVSFHSLLLSSVPLHPPTPHTHVPFSLSHSDRFAHKGFQLLRFVFRGQYHQLRQPPGCPLAEKDARE